MSRSEASGPNTARDGRLIDPRAPRFGAAVTSAVLAVALLTVPSPFATVLVALQAVVFGIGATLGLQAAPYGRLFRSLIRPRLAPPAQLEPEAPPRFAQAVGCAFTSVALLAILTGFTGLASAALALAFAAAFLNAAFGFCLGCEMYLAWRRVAAR